LLARFPAGPASDSTCDHFLVGVDRGLPILHFFKSGGAAQIRLGHFLDIGRIHHIDALIVRNGLVVFAEGFVAGGGQQHGLRFERAG
jgi:hypothetical protein